jgi:hypothetical protein
MNCKTCNDKGLIFKTLAHRQPDKSVMLSLEPVACDCCGGWSADGLVCENCIASAEGKHRPIVWQGEDNQIED